MRLPILEATAVQLTAALVEPPGAVREALFASTLESDPALRDWAQRRAAQSNPQLSPADWLSAHAEKALAFELGDMLDPPTPAHRALRQLLDRLREHGDLQRNFAERLEAEKLAAMRELAYGASHEINNPLANIASRAQTLLRDEADPEKRRKLAIINSQAFRAFEMIADLMLFAKPPAPQCQPVELRSLVDVVLAELASDATEQRTELVRSADSEVVTVSADSTQIEMALRALCRNALEALGASGGVEVSVRRTAIDDQASGELKPFAEIIVRDSGPGIPPHVRPRMFDPFYSGREAGRGLGLGLSKCWRIATLHGGRIVVDSPPQGAQLRLQLPI